jgi:hypothetical protein
MAHGALMISRIAAGGAAWIFDADATTIALQAKLEDPPQTDTSAASAFPGKLTAFRLASGWRVIQEGPGHEHLKTSQLHREWRGPFPLRALFSVYSYTVESRERADYSRGWPSL